ncbi:hypothetical protein M433DRAFT_156164 [Acidomyces richmondensis BFW]|nr:MAG: hypothetical protein FE78DRAFT_92798 [Acidomyces sp. 'richmondensis']KYG43934.1 hypothetical protein M433DRAFT_156164 [Acidomyces richmondensis BFW]
MASRVQQTTTVQDQGRNISNRLPPYEAPAFTLNSYAQYQLAALLQDTKFTRLEKRLDEAVEAISNTAGEINDRLHRGESLIKRKRNTQDEDEPEAGRDNHQENTEFADKVDRLTQRMDENMRKIIDSKYGLQSLRESVTSIVEEARANATTQDSTQHQQSQRRSRRIGSDGSTEGVDEEYPDFQPTDPTSNFQVPQSVVNGFRKKMETERTRYQSHSLAARYSDNNDYVQFRRVVHDARHPDDDVPMPPAHEWFPEGGVPAPGITARATSNHNEEDSGDDIAVQRERISTKCPLTLREFKDPLTSKKCPHSFERSAILELLRVSTQRIGNQRAVQCPCGGCKEMLTKNDMHQDAVLLRKIKRIQRAKELEEQTDGEDENVPSGQSQRNLAVIESEDGHDVDTVLKRTQMKSEFSKSPGSGMDWPTRNTAPIENINSSRDEAY